ncbi:hypothetical protein G9A89_006154 [Geosiphon pyriformis]|nr:hypothetical protein G9A89_006154 [Geosiphon pyriformis]
MIEPVGLSAGGSGSVLAGLETYLNAKKNCLDTIYFCGASYKKTKKTIIDNMIDSSAGSLSLGNIGSVGIEPVVSWNSKVGSVTGSVSKLSDVKNMTNMVAEETSYAESGENNNIDETTLRKTRIHTYMLRNLPKQPLFNCMSNNNSEQVLPPHVVLGSNKLPLLKSCAPEKQSFNLLKFFILDIELLAVSESSLKKAKESAVSKKILVNNEIRKVNSCLDQEVIIKKIPVNLSKLAVESVFSKFGKIVSIKMQLIGLWQKALVKYKSSKVASLVGFKDQHRALLYTLPVGTTAHDLSSLLESYGGRTCFIGRNPSSYVCNRCTVVCFKNEASKLAAIGSIPVYKSVNLCWAGFSLACCAKCKQLGHISTVCSLGRNSGAYGKQVVTLQNQILAIMKKLSFVELVPLASDSHVPPLVVFVPVVSNLDSEMALDNTLASLLSFLLVVVTDLVVDLSLSSSKVLTTKANKVNSVIAKAVNESSFVVLGGDFNEDSSQRCASFKKCLDFGLINFLGKSSFVKMLTWANSQGMTKTIDFLFVSTNLVNAMVDCVVCDVGKFFDTNHQAVFVSMSLGGLLDMWLNFLYKQANKDHWKFDFKENFRNATLANAEMFSDKFAATVKFSDLDAIVFTKVSSKFYRLELLVLKIVKTSCKGNIGSFIFLMKCWNSLNSVKASVVQDLINFGAISSYVYSALFGMRKFYHASKLAESLATKETNIRTAINKRMESFEMNKDYTIRSVLEHSFYKVVLDHLVVEDKLILEPNSVKSKVDVIIEGWTRKHNVIADPLDYIFDKVFSGVMHLVELNKLLNVISNLSDDKAADFSVPGSWLKAWVSIIPKPYKWEGVLMNTCPIALIKTACKILSKILSNRISLACSSFNILCKDNFLVLKSTTTQSPIFAVESMIEDALEKNQELWLEHLEKSLVRIKMCGKFIQFFGSIHKNYINRVMTDFGLTNGYCVHDGLDQGEAGLSSFFTAGVFTAIQYILDVTSEFFRMNNISINNDKTVAIPINYRVSTPSLSISGLPISIAKKDVHFFINLVLKKAVLNKQFLYLVSVVLYLIVSYRTQFSFDTLIHRGLKFKSGLPLNFSSDTVHHSFFYGLKSFFQVQSKSKIVSLVNFANSGGILGCLFSYRFHDLQVLCWCSVYLLSFPVRICVSSSNNFLAGMVCILLDCDFFSGFFLLSNDMVLSLWINFTIVMKKLDPHGPVSEWFKFSVAFLDGGDFLFTHFSVLDGVGSLNILESSNFVSVCDYFLQVGVDSLSVYMDGSFSNLGTVGCRTGAAAFFEDINLGLGIGVLDLMSSTLAELQAIALALECVPPLSSVKLFSDSQSALDAYKSELSLACSNFYNQYWVEHYHIVNVIHCKNLKVSWHKVKGHSGISRNEHADTIADDISLSGWYLSYHLGEHFLVANSSVVSGNSRHFVRDIYCSVCCICWEVGSGFKFLAGSLLFEVDWLHLSLVWHLDLHMATGFTSRPSANAHSYFMKTLHYWLLVAVLKCLYNRLYLSVLCLYCDNVEASDHVFSYKINESVRCQLLESYVDS